MNFCSSETSSSWSNEGVETITFANSSTVRCLSYHLSTFAVIAENTTIEATTEPPTIITTDQTSRTPPTTSPTTVETTIPSTEPPTSTRIMRLCALSWIYVFLAEPTEVIPCCCNEEVQRYRGFDITWNTTEKGKTVVTDCKGDGLTGRQYAD